MTDENATPDTNSKPRNVTTATLISRAYAKVQQLKQKIRKAEAVEKVRLDKYLDRMLKLEAALGDAAKAHADLTAEEREPTDAEPVGTPVESD